MINHNDKKKKLSKLAMPAKRADDKQPLGMDFEDEDSKPDLMASTSPDDDADQDMDMDQGHPDMGSADQHDPLSDSDNDNADDSQKDQQELEHVSDDELLAEIKKRGLMSKMGKDQANPGQDPNQDQDDQDLYS